jgi:uncharacterized phage infection (PIP) family protein YhgE
LITELHSEIEFEAATNETLKKDVNKLRLKIAELTDLNTALKVKFSGIAAQNQDLKQELIHKGAEAEFNNQKAIIELTTISDQLTNSRIENENLHRQLKERRQHDPESVTALKAELMESRRNNNLLLTRLRALEKTEIVRNSTDDSESLQKIKSENKNLKSLNQKLQKEIDDVREENESLRSSVRELNRHSTNRNRTIERLTKKNDELNESLEESQENQASLDFDQVSGILPQIRETVRELWNSAQMLRNDEVLEQLRRLTDKLERLEELRPSGH